MSKTVLMPKLGLTMTKGKVSKWHRKEGDQVEKGDALFEVETDKLTNTVEAFGPGVIRKILVGEGETVPVSVVVAIVAGADEDISDLLAGEAGVDAPTDKASIPTTETKKAEVIERAEGEYVRASPYAKKLVKEKGYNLSELGGTGFEGRIIAKDVLDYDGGSKVKISPVASKMASEMGIDVGSINADGRIMKDDILGQARLGKGGVEKVVANNMRKVIAERMHASWMTSPRVTYNLEVDVTNMKEFRNSLKPSFEKKGLKISYNHILMKIASKALLEFPYLNGSFDGEEITLHNYVNLGLAIDVEGGLLVPNITNVQDLDLTQISMETENLIDDIRSGNINPDTLEGGTFTITNIGMFGIDSFSPIINQPEVAILGVNRMVDKPVALNGEVVIRPMMNLSLSADHRLVDGAMAARFLARFKEIVENPYLLLA